jgi:hypothetical protein
MRLGEMLGYAHATGQIKLQVCPTTFNESQHAVAYQMAYRLSQKTKNPK